MYLDIHVHIHDKTRMCTFIDVSIDKRVGLNIYIYVYTHIFFTYITLVVS